MHGHRFPHEAPTAMHIDIKNCNTSNFYDTYHIFMTLYCIVLITCFRRSVQQKIKAHVKVNPLSSCLCSCFLIGQDCCVRTSEYLAEQAPGCINIRLWHARCSDKVSIQGGMQMQYTFQPN